MKLNAFFSNCGDVTPIELGCQGYSGYLFMSVKSLPLKLVLLFLESENGFAKEICSSFF